MSRAGAVARRAELERTESAVAFLFFVVIEHDRLPEPIRVVSDVFDYVRSGNTYVGLAFDIQLLTDNDEPPEARLVVPNTDRRIGDALRQVTERAIVSIEIIGSDEFDLTADPRTQIGTPAPIYSASHLELIDVQSDAMALSGRLFVRDYAQEPYGLRATQARCPGLWWD